MKRDKGWSLLKHLKNYFLGPWICIGDFNEIVAQSKRWGASLGRECQMEKFSDTIVSCGLSDLGFKGSQYT
jgi:hypothetical protein